MFVLVMAGAFDAAIDILKDNIWILDGYDRYAPTFHPALLNHDRAELGRILRKWEAATVNVYGFGDYWEQTPFPFEMASGK